MKCSRRIITTLMIVAAAVLMMTACGSDQQSQVNDPAAVGIEETQSAKQDVVDESGQADMADIGEEKIKAIILAKVPGAVEGNIYEFQREYDDGRIEYEGSLYYDGYEYEFEIDGATGNILQWEIDD